jgi:MoaA/NifB/PqqE/SkfB family radical SAM enzyme
MKTQKEKQYTSTATKLLHNLDNLKDIKNGIFNPISIQLAPTDKCNLNCVFCSVKNREMKELTLEEVQGTLISFRLLNAKTVEITGGGDPTMYKYINETIECANGLGYQIGLISNGVALKNIKRENLEKLTWLRISLNSLDYVKDIEIDIPSNVSLGFSYVWNDLSTIDTIKKVEEYAIKHKVEFVRIVPNCLDVSTIEKSKLQIKEVIQNDELFFIQEKQYIVPERCRIGYLKPFINSDGFIYHCSATPLINRKFSDTFRMGRIEDIRSIWTNPKIFDTSNCQEGKCFFKEHNDLIEEVMLPIKHESFI